MSKWKKLIDEPVSNELRDKTLRRAGVFTELNKNSSTHSRRQFWSFAIPATVFTALAAWWMTLRQTDKLLPDQDELMLAELDEESLQDLDIFLDMDLLEELDILEDDDEWDG